jgi:hypothetical protein
MVEQDLLPKETQGGQPESEEEVKNMIKNVTTF